MGVGLKEFVSAGESSESHKMARLQKKCVAKDVR